MTPMVPCEDGCGGDLCPHHVKPPVISSGSLIAGGCSKQSSDLIGHHRTLFPNKSIHFIGSCRRIMWETYKTIGCLYKTWAWWPLCLVPVCLWAIPQLPSDLNNPSCVLTLISREILASSQSHMAAEGAPSTLL